MQFAEELYKKRLGDKAIISLKINCEEHERVNSNIFSDKKSTTFFNNDLTLGASRYE